MLVYVEKNSEFELSYPNHVGFQSYKDALEDPKKVTYMGVEGKIRFTLPNGSMIIEFPDLLDGIDGAFWERNMVRYFNACPVDNPEELAKLVRMHRPFSGRNQFKFPGPFLTFKPWGKE